MLTRLLVLVTGAGKFTAFHVSWWGIIAAPTLWICWRNHFNWRLTELLLIETLLGYKPRQEVNTVLLSLLQPLLSQHYSHKYSREGGSCNLTEHHNTKIHFHLMPSPNWGGPFKSGKIWPLRRCFSVQFKGEARSALCKYMFLWPVRNAECTQHNGFLSLTCKASVFFYHRK